MWWKKKKPKERIWKNSSGVVDVVAGNSCPKCNQDGGLFHYDEFWDKNAPYYLCENCNAVITDEEFDRLKQIKERKAKLNQLK